MNILKRCGLVGVIIFLSIVGVNLMKMINQSILGEIIFSLSLLLTIIYFLSELIFKESFEDNK